jgi:hypothetical protein
LELPAYLFFQALFKYGHPASGFGRLSVSCEKDDYGDTEGTELHKGKFSRKERKRNGWAWYSSWCSDITAMRIIQGPL